MSLKSAQMQTLLIMGILNITPDSFSDGGLYSTPQEYLSRALELIEQGADIIDIGAESTRPGSQLLEEEEEWNRLEPTLKIIAKEKLSHSISIDTRKSSVARKALNYFTNQDMNVKYINDVSALNDSHMVSVIAEFPHSKMILNHHRGIPPSSKNVITNPNLIEEIINFFDQRITLSKRAGIKEEQIILDPGLGFGKNTEENIFILNNLGKIKRHFDLPLLIGASRKRFVREYWDTSGNNILMQDIGSMSFALLGILNGADIIRCHNPLIHKPLKELSTQLFQPPE